MLMNDRPLGLTAIQYDCIAAAVCPFLREVAPRIVSLLRRLTGVDHQHVNPVDLPPNVFIKRQ